MQRIVTGVDQDGRSHVASSEQLDEAPFINVYTFAADELAATLAGIAPGSTAEWIEPPAGGITVSLIAVPPASPLTEPPPPMPGIDDEGFHTTRTFDVALVTHGTITMLLDRETLTLEAGDIVIQRATRHAWRNTSEAPAGLLTVVHTPAAA